MHAREEQMNKTPLSESTGFGSWLRQQRKEMRPTQGSLGRSVSYSADMLRKVEAGVARPSRQLAELDDLPGMSLVLACWSTGRPSW